MSCDVGIIVPGSEQVNNYFRYRSMGIGERVKRVRDSVGLNQRDFASRLGTSAGRVSEIESGKSVPGGDLLIRLNAEFHVDLNWVLTGEESKTAAPISREEAALLDNYRHCPPEARAAIKATSALLAQSKGVRKKAG